MILQMYNHGVLVLAMVSDLPPLEEWLPAFEEWLASVSKTNQTLTIEREKRGLMDWQWSRSFLELLMSCSSETLTSPPPPLSNHLCIMRV